MTAPVLPPLPLYLGPALPRWQPRSMADVQRIIDEGTLTERHWLDAKREIGTGDGKNKEAARDMASFANDGGGLLIGVAEDKTAGTFEIRPLPLAGLSERLDEIARYRCDPPLYIVCYPLKDPKDSSQGVMLVDIPASPLAPHMVDGAYYGRGDTTRRRLTDNEVAQLHNRRTSRRFIGEQLIAEEAERDPVSELTRQNSHLYVVAQPLASPPDLLTPIIGTPKLRELVRTSAEQVPEIHHTEPNPIYINRSEPRAAGWGFYSPEQLAGRNFDQTRSDADENRVLDIEIADDGRITLMCGRASIARPVRSGEDRHYVYDVGVAVLTRFMTTLAGQLAAEAGYAGRWLFAVGVTQLRGKPSLESLNTITYNPHPGFNTEEYVEATEAATVELLGKPGDISRRLLFRLIRALGVENQGRYRSLFADKTGVTEGSV